ncbi:MAG: PspC domain-containing protein [Pseudomonadota bacterium]
MHRRHWSGHYNGQANRGGYAYEAGAPGPGPNFHRLQKSAHDRKLFGVCAGLARYFGWDVAAVRLVWALSTLFMFPFPAIAYLGLSIVLPREIPETIIRQPDDERFWRTFSMKPKETFAELKHRFRALDARIGEMERAVTSDEFSLNQAFRDLEQGR